MTGKALALEEIAEATSPPSEERRSDAFRFIPGATAAERPAELFENFAAQLFTENLPIRAHLLRDITVSGPHLFLSRGEELLAESVHPRHSAGAWAEMAGGPVRTLGEERVWIVAGNGTSNNYWHWLRQALPAILQSRRFLRSALPGHPAGLLTPPLGPYQREALSLAGLGALPRLELAPGERVTAPLLAYSEHNGGRGLFSPTEDRLAVRRRLLSAVPPGPEPPPLYVSRRDATRRPMETEAELEGLLAAEGVRIVTAGALGVAGQVALFARARLIIGLHGAGMTNTLFAPAGAQVLEIANASYLNAGPATVRLSLPTPLWLDIFDSPGAGGAGWRAEPGTILETVRRLRREV
ncbi:glycosyltransferase family 61 protein [Pseudoroseicyclus tamaricis]|uniref:Glycosyltransferase family 61 protein n=1 Tax=Pseudoroseicyclus tamaricis TaxID=2705421 RepID=A0A6B2JVW3_9RHOB|nr:glycosyltransferase 61 family protein [Pseudoroseicyclus tamaricis]NDV02045.1 glycosyltransferase family 61 protein [Pseudoroseicyclus tamaricis]